MEYRQEMPPPGGYARIQYELIPLKYRFGPVTKLLAVLCTTMVGCYLYRLEKEKKTDEKIEMRCGKLALVPMLIAERDRALLKQLKKNRDDEEKLMKDVKGWEVGKYRDSPVYLTLDPDEFFKPSLKEYFVHADPDAFDYYTTTVARY